MNDHDVIVIGAFGSRVNIPNYARAVVTTDQVVNSISSSM